MPRYQETKNYGPTSVWPKLYLDLDDDLDNEVKMTLTMTFTMTMRQVYNIFPIQRTNMRMETAN